MIKKIFLSVFFLLLICSYSFAQKDIPKDTVITLLRGPCYGNCPYYSLKISANGRVEFKFEEIGKDYKEVSSKPIISKISKEKINQLISEFEKVDFFSLADDYGNFEYKTDKNCPEVATDSSSADISITINGKTKTVFHYHGCAGNPVLEKLTELEYKIDEIVNTEQWLKDWRQKQYNREN